MREVLLGSEADVGVSRRATVWMRLISEERQSSVDPDGIVLAREGETLQIWTFAGTRVNNSLAAAAR